jgi:hypothetical protein
MVFGAPKFLEEWSLNSCDDGGVDDIGVWSELRQYQMGSRIRVYTPVHHREYVQAGRMSVNLDGVYRTVIVDQFLVCNLFAGLQDEWEYLAPFLLAS